MSESQAVYNVDGNGGYKKRAAQIAAEKTILYYETLRDMFDHDTAVEITRHAVSGMLK
jgi:hypothetical protein